MLGTRLAAGLVLALGVSALTSTAHAGDTFRLDMPGPGHTPASVPATNLAPRGADSDDVMDVGFRGGFHGGFRGYHGGFYGGGYRVGYGGFYRGGYGGFYRGGYGGFYRGGYGGFYRGGFVGHRAYYGGYGYGGYGGYGYGGYGYGGYCSPPVVYSSYYLNPCSLPSTVTAMAPAVTLKIGPAPGVSGPILESAPSLSQPVPPSTMQPIPSGESALPQPRLDTTPGTFPYDGGPKDPVPMPRIEEPPAAAPAYDMVIRPAKFVSLTETPAKKPGKWVFPAYGEESRRSGR